MPYLKKPKPIKQRQINTEDRQQIYQSSKWKKLREAKLMEQPLCEICLARGIIKFAEDVHHKDSFLNYEGNDRLWKAYDYSNLLSVCKECHSFLHRKGTTHSFDMDAVVNELNCPIVQQQHKKL